NEKATREAILQGLKWLTTDLQSEDTLTVLVSGHAVKLGEQYYFAPVDADRQHLADTCLPWQTLLDTLDKAPKTVRMMLVTADCCRAAAGLGGKPLLEAGANPRYYSDDVGNLILCAASDEDAPSYETTSGQHGILTQAWLDALQGKGIHDLYEKQAQGRALLVINVPAMLYQLVKRYSEQEG